MELNKNNVDYYQIKKLKQGEVEAFDKLYGDYAPRIYQFAVKYLKSVEDAEEVVQEVFLKLWSRRKDLKLNYSFNSYLFTIAYNVIRKKFIKFSKEKAYKDEIIFSYQEEENNLDTQINYKLLLNKVEKIIDDMPPRRKEIFLKKKYEGLSIKQIASVMNISPNTVENQLAEAQKYIKKQLGKDKLSGLLFFVLFLSNT